MSRPQSQIPILCSTCHGPAEPSYDNTIVCGYCKARDRLPADQAERMASLRARIEDAKKKIFDPRGLEGALAGLFEKRSALLPVVLFIAAGVALAGVGLYSAESVHPSIRLERRLASMIAGVVVASFGVAWLVGYLAGRRLYRGTLRHQLFARVPHEPDFPARCRTCDADLPQVRRAIMSCEYCGTKNLVTAELAEHREQLIGREKAFYAQRKAKATNAWGQASHKMMRAMGACALAAFFFAIALGVVVSRAFLGN